jgi:SPP1 gp7 family putative phage head morphogenesis protein
MQQATREAVKGKFGRKRYLVSKVVPHYPEGAEREYIRVTNAYMKEFKATLASGLPKIRDALERGGMRTDAANDEPIGTLTPPSVAEAAAVSASLDTIFAEIGEDFTKRQSLFNLRDRLEKLSNMNRKLTVAEWKRVVKRTLGIDIMDGYYNGVKFVEVFDGWVAKNVGLIKTLTDDTLLELRDIIKQGYLSGGTTKPLAKKILDLNPSDYGFKSAMTQEAYDAAMLKYQEAKRHAQFIARDQTAKLNADITRKQQEDAGVSEYLWRTQDDSYVRESHRHLNNKRFKYTDPPIVDDKTGRRANPGEDFQCRCVPLPVFDIEGVVMPWESDPYEATYGANKDKEGKL